MARKGKYAAFFLGVVFILLLIGCEGYGGTDKVSSSNDISNVLATPVSSDTQVATDGYLVYQGSKGQGPIADPWFTYSYSYISNIDVNSLPYYPTQFNAGNLHQGSVVDTLKEPLIFTDRPDYSMDKDTPSGINIHNPSSENKTVLLSLEPSMALTDPTTGIEYAATPVLALNWIELSSKQVEIPAHAIAHVPVRVTVPSDISKLKLPSKWNFCITMVEKPKAKDYYQTAHLQYWFMSMQ